MRSLISTTAFLVISAAYLEGVSSFTTTTSSFTTSLPSAYQRCCSHESSTTLNSLTTKEEELISSNAVDVIPPTTNFFSSEMGSAEVVSSEILNSFDEDNNNNNNNDNTPGWLEPLAWRGVILVLCALWASNFAAAKLVMAEPGVDSSLYAVARFGVSAAALAPGAISIASKKNVMDAEIVKGALGCGAWVAFGYLGQTLGLLTTTASKSCVICSMHCVFVAVISELWRVQRCATETKYDVTRLLPAAVAVAGVAIVELKGAGGAPTIGDALSFAQPIGFGMGYLQLEGLMSKRPEAALPVSALKLLVVAVASLGLFELSPLMHDASSIADFSLRVPDFGPIINSPLALGGILYTGLITTAFALWVESIAFAKVPATDASIILTTEPLIAAGVGAMTLGETFGTSDYFGASLIIGACALAVLLDAPEEGVEEAASA